MTISRARCCDLEQHQIDHDPAEAARGQATRLSDLLAAATSAVPVSPLLLGRRPPASRLRIPPPETHRRLDVRSSLQKQSFLI